MQLNLFSLFSQFLMVQYLARKREHGFCATVGSVFKSLLGKRAEGSVQEIVVSCAPHNWLQTKVSSTLGLTLHSIY